MIEDWPIYCRDSLTRGSPNSPVAVCTLWTKQDVLVRPLDPARYCVVGNLYSKDGINFLLRNILANPRIRFLVTFGMDRTLGGETLEKLFRHGIDGEHRVVGDGTPIDAEISRDAIELLRTSVTFIDMRKAAVGEVKQRIESLETFLPPFSPHALVFPRRVPRVDVFPSEDNVFVVRGKLVAEVWLEILAKIMTFGRIGETQHSVGQKELLNLISIVEGEDPDHIYWVDWFPFDREDLEGRKGSPKISHQQLVFPFVEESQGYYAHVLTPASAPDLSYTYGERLFDFDGINQIQDVINELRAASYSRRAVASLWNPVKDHASTSPPCLDLVQFELRDGKLHLTAYIRSNDMYRAWPQNAFALRKLQKIVAVEIGGCTLGDTITISNSAHVYEDSWELAKGVLSKHYGKISNKQRKDGRDPRGNFAIRNEHGQITVEHYSMDGKYLGTISAKSARELSKKLLIFISAIDHALYLGAELQKAEIALLNGLGYRQDRPIELHPVELCEE